MKHYEGMFILHNRELPEEEAAITPEMCLTALVEKVGGTVHHTVPWANRKLAYPIKGNQTGNYVLTYYSGEAGVDHKLRHEVAISDRILRVFSLAVEAIPGADALPGPLTEPGARASRAAVDGEDGEEAPVGAEPVDEEALADSLSDPERKARARAVKEEVERLDYKNVYHLRRMITSQGKLFSRVRSGLDAKRQRKLRVAVYRARNLALLPFVAR